MIENIMMRITTKADRNSSAGTAIDSEKKMRIYSSASIAANPCCTFALFSVG
jgi:hypothetical protein